MDLDCLVVGDLGSTDWKYSRFGTKLEKAIENRVKYGKLKIVTEKQFVQTVMGD